MGGSRAGTRTGPHTAAARPPGAWPAAVLEFAIGQAIGGGPEFSALPAVLQRFAVAFGGQAALVLDLAAGQPPVLVAAHPPDRAADTELLAQVAARIAERPEVLSDGGCVRSALPAPPRGGRPGKRLAEPPAVSVLAACPEPAAGLRSRAVILIGGDARRDPEAQATARGLAAVLAAQQRRAAESRELADRAAVTAALIDASPDAVVVTDVARRIVEFNPAAEALYGRRRADVLGQDMAALLIPERDRARFLAGTERYLSTGDPGEFTGRLQLPALRADGSERLVEVTTLPVVVMGDTYFCAFLRDIGELERASAALARSEARFRLLSELAPVGIAQTDRSGTCCFVNDRWCVLSGRPAADFIGACWTTALRPDDAEQVARAWAGARAKGAELRMDCRLRPAGSSQVWVHASIAALPEGTGSPGGFLVALTNVSARKRGGARRRAGRGRPGRRA